MEPAPFQDGVTEAPWDLVVAGPARRAIDRLPEKIAPAVLDCLVGPPSRTHTGSANHYQAI